MDFFYEEIHAHRVLTALIALAHTGSLRNSDGGHLKWPVFSLISADAEALVSGSDSHIATFTPCFTPWIAVDYVWRSLLDAKSDCDNEMVQGLVGEAALVIDDTAGVASENWVVCGNIRKNRAWLECRH
jgi:hypothetical protein